MKNTGTSVVLDLNHAPRFDLVHRLGFTEEQAYEQFGFLLNAFSYGVPPHGGLAIGLDRMVMLMSGSKRIRDVIAFPKVQNSSDLMTDAPAAVSEKQLDELCLQFAEELSNDR